MVNFKKSSRKFKPRGNTTSTGRRRTMGSGSAARAAMVQARRGASTAAQAKRTGGWANPSIGGERKFVDTDGTYNPGFGVATFAGAGATLLNGIANGTDASTRIGRKAIMKTILLRVNFSMAATSTRGGAFRILVVYDKQTNAAAPAITDILVTDNFNSANNLSNRDRFVTIFDQITDPVDAGGPCSNGVVLYKKINLETLWNAGTTAAVGSIASGAIYMFIAQTGGILVANPSLVVNARVRYTDN